LGFCGRHTTWEPSGKKIRKIYINLKIFHSELKLGKAGFFGKLPE
jgi:hypothetical protein